MKTALCVFFLSLSALGQTVSFAAPKNYYGGIGCTYAIVGDWNGDGKQDIGCVSGEYITTHLGNGDGTFQHYVQTKWPYQNKPPYQPAVQPLPFRLITNQTALAVVVPDGSHVDIWLPTSTGSFYYKESLYPNECPAGNNCNYWGWSNVISGDFNGDGNIDLAFGRQAIYGVRPYELNSWGEIDYWPGNGDGTFGNPQALASDGGGPRSLVGISPQLIEMNNNTLVAYSGDNVWKTEYTSGDFCWHVGAPCWHPVYIPGDAMASANDGYLWTFLSIPPSLPTGNVLFGEFRNSLSAFLIPAYNDDNTTSLIVFINVFGNRSRRSSTVPGTFNPTSASRFDSHLDVAGTYFDQDSNTGAAIFFGNGNNTFNPNPLFMHDPSGYVSQSIQVADFNGDNKLDIVSAMQSSTKHGELEVLLNSSIPETPTVDVGSSLNPSTYGETVTFTATVTPNPLNWPTESVTFYSGTAKIAKAQLVNGTASVSTTKLEPGTHTITAAYSGDCCDYLPGSTSLTQVVVK
jgi:hypothetical protein